VPVDLHVHAARPLDDGVPADRVWEGGDQHIRAAALRGGDGDIHIGDEIAVALGAERIGDWGEEAEKRDGAGRCLQKLRGGAARRGGDVGDDLFCAVAAECGEEAADESGDFRWRDVDMRGVVLRGDGDGWGVGVGKR